MLNRYIFVSHGFGLILSGNQNLIQSLPDIDLATLYFYSLFYQSLCVVYIIFFLYLHLFNEF